MTRRNLLKVLDTGRIKEAIQNAEQNTSGQIRVSVSTLFWGDPRKAAERAFHRLGMRATRHRNGVLLFIVPARRRFVVLGDEGIHEKVGQAFWDHVRSAMANYFRDGKFTDGIVHGVETAGNELATHFPKEPGGENELPDDVDLG